LQIYLDIPSDSLALSGWTVRPNQVWRTLKGKNRIAGEPRMIPKYLEDSRVKQFCSPNGEFAISYSRDELEVCSTTLTVKWMFLAKV
jgi:hypothetical protein